MRRAVTASVWAAAMVLVCFGWALAWGQAESAPPQEAHMESPPSSEARPEADGAGGDSGAGADAPPVAADPEPSTWKHRVKLTDGSLFVGRLSAGELRIETAYGSLTVPTSDIVGLQPGLDHRPALRKRIERHIRDLAAAEYEVRQKAMEALVRMGPAVRPFVAAHADDQDAERKQLVAGILEQFDRMRDAAPLDGESFKPIIAGDRLATSRFTIVGRLQVSELTVRTDYAEFTLPLARIERIEHFDPTEPKVVTERLTVSGDHKASINHKRTGIRLRRGDRVSIKAEGRITMTPWGSNAFSVPDGMPNYGTYMNDIHQGALVARVGGSGRVFKVGSEHTFTAENAGELELAVAINHSYASRNFPGNYEVTVRVDRSGE